MSGKAKHLNESKRLEVISKLSRTNPPSKQHRTAVQSQCEPGKPNIFMWFLCDCILSLILIFCGFFLRKWLRICFARHGLN